ncbi:MAG: phenylalanine 4-monooxygenase, partial [Gammaproteobacteria bacterium]|nr:phenylalanine 4-monooxygenase [Gammaproteobacteria bacterium]
YWYTVEFGLINGNGGGNGKGGLRAYGAGILSSPTELRFALEARSPNRIHLSVDRVMRTDYTISDLQQSYFVIDSFEQLFAMTEARVFDPIYQSLEPGFKYASAAVLDTDHVYTRGTQEYALRGGRSSGTTPC